MAGPVVAGAVIAPNVQIPFVVVHNDGYGYLTPPAFQLLQLLYSVVTANSVSWTPTLAGTTTPGANTYAAQSGSYVQMGNVTFAFFSVTLSHVDPAIAGNVIIGGAPSLSSSSATASGFMTEFANVTLAAGASQLGVSIQNGGLAFDIFQSGPGIASAPLAASDLTNTSSLTGGAIFFR